MTGLGKVARQGILDKPMNIKSHGFCSLYHPGLAAYYAGVIGDRVLGKVWSGSQVDTRGTSLQPYTICQEQEALVLPGS